MKTDGEYWLIEFDEEVQPAYLGEGDNQVYITGWDAPIQIDEVKRWIEKIETKNK